ncbi:LuxR C-terminal-related transcriptional regulator [Burkholderia anthina]|uniref:helix-turn-helix transcriptional regulator n=1 Tax=Burkholderia anthina TaxID=179879 RepID=UPI00158A93E3|nr:LuxR C-terminal-related transcriptional regulator [Burkholderia anthina]
MPTTAHPPAPAGADLAAATPDELSDLIGLVYEGVTSAVPWHGLLDALRVRLAANYATLVLRPPADQMKGLIVTSSLVDTSVGTGAYLQRFYTLDAFVNLPRDTVTTVHEMLGERGWLDSEKYRNFDRMYDVLHVMGADIHVDADNECRLRICRPHGAPPFDANDKRLCRFLLPHLKRAASLRASLEVATNERHLYAETVSQLRIGAILLDEQARVMKTNDDAAQVLAERDGLFVVDGKLACDGAANQRMLHALVRDALARKAGAARGMTLARRAGRARLGLLVRPLPIDEQSGRKRRAAAVVLVRDPDCRPQISGETLQAMFNLTRSEASLVLHLTQGLSLQDAAETMAIRHNTARSHLRAVFSKMGVTRQTELIQAIEHCVIPLQ